jgi:hypothetical protein
MDVVVDILLIIGGVLLVLAVLDSAIRTFMLPRSASTPLTRSTFVTVRWGFSWLARDSHTYERRDRVMALYAPVGLLVLVGVWMVLAIIGFAMVFFTLVPSRNWREAFELSGSSFFTLGFVLPPDDVPSFVLAFLEAATGLALLALLIAYVPTIYGAFSRRELAVAQLATRAGTPPSAVELLQRYHAIGWNEHLTDLWAQWELWFAEISETHTSLAILTFFRSPSPERSWVTAAGTVLDAAALAQSTMAIPWNPQAGLCIRSGYLALREISDYFGLPYDPDPQPDAPISIAKEEFYEAYEQLGGAGVPVRPDRERAWREFAGWRVNYDAVLLGLAGLTMAPYASWSSDRSLSYRRPRVVPWGRRSAKHESPRPPGPR